MMRKTTLFLLSSLIFSGTVQASEPSRDFPVPQTVSADMQKSIAAENNTWKFDIKSADEWFPLIDSSYQYGSHNSKIMADYFKVSIDVWRQLHVKIITNAYTENIKINK